MDKLTDRELEIFVKALDAYARTPDVGQGGTFFTTEVVKLRQKLIAEMGGRCAAEYIERHGRPQA